MFVTLLIMIACGGASTDPAAPVEAPPVVAPAADPHAAHKSMDHMAVMAATRDRLRAELGEAYDPPVPGLDTADATRGNDDDAYRIVVP